MSDNQKTLLLFDIDGTILRMKNYRSYRIICDLFRRRYSAEIDPHSLPSFSGKTDLQILADTSAVAGVDFRLVERDIDTIWDELLAEFALHCHEENLELLPGVPELLSALHADDRFQLALVTGNFTANAYLKLSVFGIGGYFPFGAFGSDAADRNELPGIAVLRGNQFAGRGTFSIGRSIIIGDSHLDVACAQANGIPCLAVATGNHSASELSDLGATTVHSDFSDLYSSIAVFDFVWNQLHG